MPPRNDVPLAIGLAAAALIAPGPAAAAWRDVFPGGRYRHVTADGQDYHLLKVDLCQPGVHVRATRAAERGQVVSAFGDAVGARAAINGDFFTPDLMPVAPAMGNGRLWGGEDGRQSAPAAFGPAQVELPLASLRDGVPDWARQVVSGHPTLLDDGDYVGAPNDPLCSARNPRTAIGLSQDRRTLLIAVVDGRRAGAAGMTCPELGDLMATHGAYDALNLDGGGSSTLWLSRGGVANTPSDGHERTVANHLAVISDGGEVAEHCPLPAYAAEWVGQTLPRLDEPALEVAPGQAVEGTIELRNAGYAAWGADTRLAALPRDADSPFAAPTWETPARIGPAEAETAPGDVGRFHVVFNPRGTGDQRLLLTLVRGDATWFGDAGGPPDGELGVHLRVGATADAGGAADALPRPDAGGAADLGGVPAPDTARVADEGGPPDAVSARDAAPAKTGSALRGQGCQMVPGAGGLGALWPAVWVVLGRRRRRSL